MRTSIVTRPGAAWVAIGRCDREDAVLEARRRAPGIDVLGELHLALERPVLDLHLLVDAARRRRPPPLAGDDEQSFGCDHADALRIDARKLDHDGQRMRVLGVEAVDVGPEAVAGACGEPGHVPEVCEQLLDLRLELVDVTPSHHDNVPRPGPSGAGTKIQEMDVIHPRWSAWTYLTYAGGFVLLGAATTLLSYLSGEHGAAVYALFSLIVFAGFAVSAWSLQQRGERIAAGVFAFIAVNLFGAFVVALYTWFGWLSLSSGPFSGFSLARLTFVLFTLVAALVALRTFRFPLLMLTVVELVWFFVTDLISGGGDWSAVVTFFIGLAFLGWAVAVDGGPDRPYGMWLHVGAGLTIGGSLLWFLHHGHFEWALIVLAGLIYLKLAEILERSSWAVLGSLGILAAAAHYTTSYSHARISPAGASGGGSRGWVPALVFGLAGGLLLVAGGVIGRRSGDRPDAGSVSN